MKDNYIELIEKTASESLYEPKARMVKKKNRPASINKFIKDNNLEDYEEYSPVVTGLFLDADKVVNKAPESYGIVSTGTGEKGNHLCGTTMLKDLARDAAIKNNKESEYDSNLDKIRRSIKARKAVGKGAKGALTLGGALLGAGLGGVGSGSIAGAATGGIAGLMTGGLAGRGINKKIDRLNTKHYLNSLEDYQRDSINSTLSEYADKATDNPYFHKTTFSVGE